MLPGCRRPAPIAAARTGTRCLREGVVRAGVSVAGRVVREDEAGPLEHHVVDWGDDDGPDDDEGGAA